MSSLFHSKVSNSHQIKEAQGFATGLKSRTDGQNSPEKIKQIIIFN
jgi:hypothetical protein